MSMDFVYDLTEKFEQQEIDYFLITIRRSKRKEAADVFYHLRDSKSGKTLLSVFEKLAKDDSMLNEILKKGKQENRIKDKNGTGNKKNSKKTPKKRRGRSRGKEGEE